MESREEAPRDPEPPRLLPKRRWTRRLRKQLSQYYDWSDAWQVWKYSPQTPSGVGTSQPETRQHPQRPLPRIQKGEAHLWRYSPQKHQLREGANHSLEPAHSEWRDDAPQPPGPPRRSHSARNHHRPSPWRERRNWSRSRQTCEGGQTGGGRRREVKSMSSSGIRCRGHRTPRGLLPMRVGHLIGGNGHSLELRNGTRIIQFKSENESLVVEVDLEVPEAANQANPHEPQWRDPSPPETSPPLADKV